MAKPKLKDILSAQFKAIGIDQKDADMILSASALNEIELPEDFNSKFDTAYYTPERAKATLGSELKPEHFGHFATDLERKSLIPLMELLPEEYKQKIATLEKNGRVYGILEIIKDAYNNAKTNGSTDDIKKVNEKHRLTVEELNKKILDLDGAVKTQKTEFETQAEEIKKDFALRGKFLSYKFAPEFDGDKNSIVDIKLESLKKRGYLVEFDKENSQVIHLRQKKDGAITDVYEGNTKVSLDNLLEKELSPFTLKSNGTGSGTPPPPSTQPQVIIQSDRPKDLFEQIRQGATA